MHTSNNKRTNHILSFKHITCISQSNTQWLVLFISLIRVYCLVRSSISIYIYSWFVGASELIEGIIYLFESYCPKALTTCCTWITTQRSRNHGNCLWPLNNTANICSTVNVPGNIIVETMRGLFAGTFDCICSKKIYNMGK